MKHKLYNAHMDILKHAHIRDIATIKSFQNILKINTALRVPSMCFHPSGSFWLTNNVQRTAQTHFMSFIYLLENAATIWCMTVKENCPVQFKCVCVSCFICICVSYVSFISIFTIPVHVSAHTVHRYIHLLYSTYFYTLCASSYKRENLHIPYRYLQSKQQSHASVRLNCHHDSENITEKSS